jgi:hypothetical protein
MHPLIGRDLLRPVSLIMCTRVPDPSYTASLPVKFAQSWPMPALVRRPSPDRPDCWHVYYGDVQVGTIARRVGNPHDTDPWEWMCGFYPGCKHREHQNGTSATSFDRARADFEAAWAILLPKRTEANFQAWRRHKA